MKKTTIAISSFIAGAICMVSASVFAAPIAKSITAQINEGQIIRLNGADQKVSQPSINYEGKTYLYIKDVASILGVDVQWHPWDKSVNIWAYKKDEVPSSIPIVDDTPVVIPIANSDVPLGSQPELERQREQHLESYTNGYASGLNINGNLYMMPSFPVYQDKEGRFYADILALMTSDSQSLAAVIEFINGNYSFDVTTNPYFDGIIKPSTLVYNYSNKQRHYIDSMKTYIELTLYSSDKTKSYFISTKPNEEKGFENIGNQLFIPLSEIFSQLGYNINISVDETSKIITFEKK